MDFLDADTVQNSYISRLNNSPFSPALLSPYIAIQITANEQLRLYLRGLHRLAGNPHEIRRITLIETNAHRLP